MLNQERILQGNKEIAKFMGMTYYGSDHPLRPEFDKTSKFSVWCGWKSHPDVENIRWETWHPLQNEVFLSRSHKGLLYHKKWDWLMPVVQKIGKLDFEKHPGLRKYMDVYWKRATLYSPIELIHECVVDLIEFINEVKQNNDER